MQRIEEVAPGLRRILAPNPSPMTGPGTNTWLLGRREIAVIDPGPAIPAHLEAIRAAAGDGRITHILVTHAHLDHSALAPALGAATGAPVCAFGGPEAGRSALMAQIGPDAGGGEGVDRAFAPDLCLPDKARLSSAEWEIEALHTPGHFGGHLGFRAGDAIFTGDVVMAWTTTLISPPDGDLAQYLATLDRLAREGAACFHPAHGASIHAPETRLAELRAHRLARHAQIRAELRHGPATAAGIATRLYAGLPPALLPAAARNVLAHLLEMTRVLEACPEGPLHPQAAFALAQPGAEKLA